MDINKKNSPGEIQNRPLHMEGTKIPNKEADHSWLVDGRFDKGFPGSSAGKESTCNAGDPSSIPGSERSPGQWRGLPTPVFVSFPGALDGKESTCNVEDLGSVPGLGRSPRDGKGYPLQYSILENSTDCIVHGVSKSQTGVSNYSWHIQGWINYITLMK